MSESDDIREVRATEGRVKKPAEKLTRRQLRRITDAFEEGLRRGDRDYFEQVIRRELGLASESYVRALKLWDDYHGG